MPLPDNIKGGITMLVQNLGTQGSQGQEPPSYRYSSHVMRNIRNRMTAASHVCGCIIDCVFEVKRGQTETQDWRTNYNTTIFKCHKTKEDLDGGLFTPSFSQH